MIPAYLLLLIPFIGIIYFAMVGHQPQIGRINTWFNAASLLMSIWLALNVFFSGTILSDNQYILIDSFNVYLADHMSNCLTV
jgi:hydrogenase-4 component F